MSKRNKTKAVVAFLTFLYLSIYMHKEASSVITPGLFDYFSEGYVVCTMIRDATDPSAGNTKLGLGVYPDKALCYSKFDDSAVKLFTAADAYSYSDDNWNAGIARSFPAFMLQNTLANYLKYTPGAKLRLPDGSTRTIQQLQVDPLYMNVRLDGPILDQASLSANTRHRDLRITDEFRRYGSQLGVPGYLFGGLFKELKIEDLNVYRGVNSTLLAASLAIVIYFLFVEFGFAAGFAMVLAVMFSPWLMGVSGNLYWMAWTWFAPLALTCFLMSRIDRPFARRVRVAGYLSYALLIGLKAACGYEYMSSVMLMSVVPMLYAGIVERAGLLKILVALIKLGMTGCAAFLAAVLLHAQVLAGSVSLGLQGIRSDMARRTYASGSQVQDALGNGASDFFVIKRYFETLLQPVISGFHGPFVEILVPLMIVALLLFVSRDVKKRALAASFLFSLLAPLSWFVLAKGHSFVHIHINPVLWDVPSVPLGIVCLAVAAQSAYQSVSRYVSLRRAQMNAAP